jgi:hypothetical protein
MSRSDEPEEDYGQTRPRPDKTEMELFLLIMLLVVPFAYFAFSAVFALIGG